MSGGIPFTIDESCMSGVLALVSVKVCRSDWKAKCNFLALFWSFLIGDVPCLVEFIVYSVASIGAGPLVGHRGSFAYHVEQA